MVELSTQELIRYRRQIMIPGFGEEGQRKLKQATVLVTYIGGLGGPAAIELVMAGIGHLIVVHPGEVELSNLNRMILQWEEDLGRPRAISAGEKLRRYNLGVKVTALAEDIDEETISQIIEGCDVVVSATPFFEKRFILNQVCVEKRKPLVEGAMYGLEGRLTTIIPGKTPCLACLYPTKPFWKIPFPVLGAVSGTIGCLEALEAVKIITGCGKPLLNKLLFFDGEAMEFRIIPIARKPDCPICGDLKME